MTRSVRSIALTLVCGLIVACGGGGGGNDPTDSAPPASTVPAPQPAKATGTVAILLTDAAGHDYDQAFATITSIELVGEGERVVLFEGEETIDLLRLEDFYEFFAVSSDVPAGTEFNKIRLRVADHLELNTLDDDGNVVDSVLAELPGRGKLDLNNQGTFSVDPDSILIVEIDWQMNKAFKTIETGNGRVKVRPVIMVNVTSVAAEQRLARIFGVIDQIDAMDASFRLCRTGFVADDDDVNEEGDDDGACVRVRTTDDTGVFGEDGLPLTFADLMAGDEVTTVGSLMAVEDDRLPVVDVPPGFLPPPGDCRIWLLDEAAPEQQPAPGDCDDLGDDVPDGAVLIDDQGAVLDGSYGDYFALDAIVVERGPEGTFRSWEGTARSMTDADDRFALELAAGQGFAPETVVPVQLAENTPIVTRTAEGLDRSVIADGVELTIDGVLVLADDAPDTLRAALLIVDMDAPADDLIRGAVADVDPDAGTLVVTADGGDLCVDADDADIFVVTVADDTFTTDPVSLADLIPGQRVDVYGDESPDGCFDAETIIAEAVENLP